MAEKPIKISLAFEPDKVDAWLSHAIHGWADMRESKGNWRKRGGLRFSYDMEDDNEGDMNGRATVKREDVARGLAVMATSSPYLFGQMLSGNDDIETCDSLFQCIVFGKEIYG